MGPSENGNAARVRRRVIDEMRSKREFDKTIEGRGRGHNEGKIKRLRSEGKSQPRIRQTVARARAEIGWETGKGERNKRIEKHGKESADRAEDTER